MTQQRVAFDVDGTLLDLEDNINYEVVDLLRWFLKQGWDVTVHSGGGVDYARVVVRRLGLTGKVKVAAKDGHYDLAVDDQGYKMADKCIYVNTNQNEH